MEEKPAENAPGDIGKQTESGAISAKNRVCPQCGTVNPPESLYCCKCGLKLADVAVQDKKICAGCKATNSPTSEYCYRCGLKLPEQISVGELTRKYAGFWVRLLAFIIDGVLIYIITSIVAAVVYASIYGLSSYTSLLSKTGSGKVDNSVWSFLGIAVLTWLIVAIVYSTVAIGKWGRTIGKVALKLKVLKCDGSRAGYWRAFGRSLAYILNNWTLGIGFMVIAFTEKKRGLHDYICDTIVIKTG